MLNFLREEHIDEGIVQGILEFRNKYGTGNSYSGKTPRYVYYGKEIWEQAAQALLCGKNLLLAGAKATGKNMPPLARARRLAIKYPHFHGNFPPHLDIRRGLNYNKCKCVLHPKPSGGLEWKQQNWNSFVPPRGPSA